jgi:hypothetical protein
MPRLLERSEEERERERERERKEKKEERERERKKTWNKTNKRRFYLPLLIMSTSGAGFKL